MYVHRHPYLRRWSKKMSTKLASVHPALLPTSCHKFLPIMGILLAHTAKSVEKFSSIKCNFAMKNCSLRNVVSYLVFIFGKCGCGIVFSQSQSGHSATS